MADLTTRQVIKPGKPGTKRLHKIYGDQLVCVRYRYDWVRRKRLKTIELIVDEVDWKPSLDALRPDTLVFIKLSGLERELRLRVMRAGGQWKRNEKLWQLSLKEVVKLGLKNRIIWE